MAKNELEELYARYVTKGDLGALAKVFDSVAPDLQRLAVKLSGDQSAADDLVQETFLTALERPQTFDRTKPLIPWLMGIMVHRARASHRIRSRTPDHERLEERHSEEPDSSAILNEHQAAVREAILTLPQSLRVVVEGKLEGRDSESLAGQLGISQGAMRGRLHRALHFMRAALPPGLATLFAIVFLHSPGLAQVRTKVLVTARNTKGPQGLFGAGGALVTGSLLMTKNAIVLVALLALVPGWMGLQMALANEDSDPVDAVSPQIAVSDSLSPGTANRVLDEKPEPVMAPMTGNREQVQVVDVVDGEEVQPGPVLSGIVVDEDGNPVGGAELHIWSKSYEWRRGDAPDRTQLADANGNFAITGLGRTFTITAHTDFTYCQSGLTGERRLVDDLGDQRITLAKSNSLVGKVVDDHGSPVAGAEVWATFKTDPTESDWTGTPNDNQVNSGPTAPKLEAVSTTTTDSLGQFRLSGVGEFMVFVHVKKAPFLVYRAWHEPADDALLITLDPGLSLRGRVVDKNGQPAVGAIIRKYPYTDIHTAPRDVITDANGRFRLISLDEIPDYQFEGWGASNAITVIHEGHAVEVVQPLPVARGTEEEIYIKLEEQCELSGHVVDLDGKPIPGAKVRIEGTREMNPGFSMSEPTTWEWSARLSDTKSGKSGEFHFDKLYPGPYWLYVTDREDDKLFLRVSVQANDMDIKVVLDRRASTQATLQGVVRDAFTGEPIPKFTVTPMIDGSGSMHSFHGPDGSFELKQIPGVLTTLNFSADGYSQTSLEPQTFPIGTTDFDIGLLPTRQVSLSVIDQRGQPRTGGSCEVTDAKGKVVMLETGPGRRSTSVQIGQGKVILKGLPAELVTLHLKHAFAEPMSVEIDLTAPLESEFEVLVPLQLPLEIQLFVFDEGVSFDTSQYIDIVRATRDEERPPTEEELALIMEDIGTNPLAVLSQPVSIEVFNNKDRLLHEATITPHAKGFGTESTSWRFGSNNPESSVPVISLRLTTGTYRVVITGDGYQKKEFSLDVPPESDLPLVKVANMIAR